MKIVLAADHAGFSMKEDIKVLLTEQGHTVEDVGAHTMNPVDDYPAYMHDLAKRVAQFSDTVGIMFGGSGQGESIVANRHPGVRAIVYPAHDPEIVTLGRRHNDANVLSIGARLLTDAQMREAVELFLSTPFSAEDRHIRRIGQIDR